MGEYKLVGIREDYEYEYGGYTGRSSTVEDVVATFSTIEKAEQYVVNSRLKSKSGYKSKSLLSYYDSHEIVYPEGEDEPPHDPFI